ncbi:hypothetical protein EUTSA_v10000589mg [Eutrema salsugineum]|uniref:Ionotropic glutamate receptor C-terminal domain-containing protein n=1 Tax=Eutrema salsugineum TaxID=72664 RepID=V4L7X8_EUTSA|nr:hypothetical protein EUTSA_v10000589mg [Eutrema salsugineum]
MRNKRVFFFVLFCFFFSVELSRGQNNKRTEVNVGVVTDVGIMHSDIEMLCINLSLADFYSSRPQFQTRLVVSIGDSKDDVVGAAAAALELIKNKRVKAIVGPWTSMQAHFLIEISQKSQVPLVSYSAISPFLTSLRSPYFFRATYEDSFQVNAIKAIIKLFGIMPRLTDALQEINVRIPHRSVIALNATDAEISVELLKMMTMPTRVFIVHMYTALATRFFIKAKEIGLMKPEYVWILTNGVTDDLSLMDEKGIEAMEGVLGVKTYIQKSEDLDKFRARWRKRFPRMDLSVYGLWAYDAITALAIAIEEAGTNNLTFSNANAGRNVSELEPLGLSQYGPQLLQTLSRARFKGLVEDFRFVKGQLQPSVFEIVNVVGTGERSIGVNPDFRGPANYQASTIFWFAFSTMVFAPREKVYSFGARILVITWYFIVLVLTQSYTASLASLLTSQEFYPTITSMRSLLERGETVGYQRTSFILGKLKETGFSHSSLVPFDTAEQCDELMRKGEKGGVSAAFLEIPYLRLFLGQYCNTYKMVEEPINVDGFGFVFPIGSPLVADVSRAILKVAESPKGMELERAWFKKKEESCPDPVTNPDPNPSFTSRQLGLDSFWLLFLIAFVICALTLGKFTVCFLWNNRDNRWQRLHQQDNDSYINNVEMCPCSLNQSIPRNPANPAPAAAN